MFLRIIVFLLLLTSSANATIYVQSVATLAVQTPTYLGQQFNVATPSAGSGQWIWNGTSMQAFQSSNGTPTSTPTNTPTITNTPTPTNTPTFTNTFTPTPTFTYTPTGVATVVNNQAATFRNGTLAGVGPTNTPIPGSNFDLNAQICFKSFGSGTAVTPTPAIVSNSVTIYHASHGYSNGDYVVLIGATASPTPEIGINNVPLVIANVTTNTYSVTVPGTGSIAGTISELYFIKAAGNRSFGLNYIASMTRSGTGFTKISFVNAQTDAFYGIYLGLFSNGSNTLLVVPDTNNPPSTTSFGIQCINNNGASSVGEDPTIATISLSGIQ